MKDKFFKILQFIYDKLILSIFELARKNLKDVIIWGSGFVVVYLIFLFLFFPFEKIFSGVFNDIERQHRIKIVAGEISPRIPLGVSCENVQISGPRLTGGKTVKLDKVNLNVGVFSLILYPFTRNISFDFYMEQGKGSAEGSFASGKDTNIIGVKTESLNLEGFAPLLSQYNFSLAGTLDASILIILKADKNNRVDFSKIAGEVDIKAASLSVNLNADWCSRNQNNDTINLLCSIPLNLSSLEPKAEIKDGVIILKSLSLQREGLSGNIQGKIKLEREIPDTYLDLDINLKLATNETLVRSFLMMKGQSFGCPLNPDGTAICKLRGIFREISQPKSIEQPEAF
jgi:type II secretion system protein N